MLVDLSHRTRPLHGVHDMSPSVISWAACGTRGRDREPSIRNKPRVPTAGAAGDGSKAGVAVVAVIHRVVADWNWRSNVGVAGGADGSLTFGVEQKSAIECQVWRLLDGGTSSRSGSRLVMMLVVERQVLGAWSVVFVRGRWAERKENGMQS